MTTQTRLRESVTDAPVKSGNRWKVIVARPGQGSSGKYSEELFERDAHKIIAPGGQAFINHDATRKPTEMIGVYPEGAFWSSEDKAVVAELEVFSHWKAFVEEVGPHCGMSLYALGEMDEDGNVTSFIEDSYNGADLVSRPGLEGSGLAEKLYEAAKIASVKPSDEDPSQERKDNKMDEKAIEAINALTAQVSALVSASNAKVEQESQTQANDEAVKEALESIQANVDAVEAERENLSAKQVESLRAKAFAGQDVTEMIAEAKELRKEIMAEVADVEDAPSGRILGEAKTTSYGAWK